MEFHILSSIRRSGAKSVVVPVLFPYSDTPATEATVFMLVGLKEYWKTPIGYVLENKMKGGDIASFVEKILEFTLANGIYIKSITFNHAGENLSAAK